MRYAILLSTLMLIPAAPARAIEPHQAAAIDRIAANPPPGKSVPATMAAHYAVLLWVEDYCSGRSLESVRNYLAGKGSGDREAFDAAWLATTEMLVRTEPKAMCALALEQYGPGGTLIKGAWAPR